MYVYIYFVKKSEGKKLCNFLAFRERTWNKKSVNKTKVAIHDVFGFFFCTVQSRRESRFEFCSKMEYRLIFIC